MRLAHSQSGNSANRPSTRLALRNRRYPTYQLFAYAGCGKAQPEAVLKIAILETLNWLRQRFRAFDLPTELDWPAASQYDTADSKDFKTYAGNGDDLRRLARGTCGYGQ